MVLGAIVRSGRRILGEAAKKRKGVTADIARKEKKLTAKKANLVPEIHVWTVAPTRAQMLQVWNEMQTFIPEQYVRKNRRKGQAVVRGGGSEGEGAVFFYDDDADGSGSLQQNDPDITGAIVSRNNTDITLRAGGNTDRFTVHSNGNATLTGTLSESDERLKENIADITNPIQSLNALTGKTFTWKPELDMPEGTKYGFIAQEVEKVLPDLVESSCGIKVFDKDGKLKRMEDEENTFLETDEYAKSIQINGLIPLLVEAVKELSAKNDTLETKVTALENA